MSSWFELLVGDVRVTYGSNHVDSSLFLPFQTIDLVSTLVDDEENGALKYEAPSPIVGRRLDLLGFTMANAVATYREALDDARERFPHYQWPPTLADWQLTVRAITSKLREHDLSAVPLAESYVWEETLLGFPGAGVWQVVRALVDSMPEALVTLDLTDLARGGYVADDGSDLFPEREREPLIILTEGKSDARLLRSAIDTLFPDYSEFIRLIDYDFAKAAGGVGEVVRFVKMFCGAGIKNRIVALFDNDTAGHEACGQLAGLPSNVFPLCLPSLEMFASYPTIGPNGETLGNIDGRACALELYLGRDALTDERGHLRPVRWTGYSEKMVRYQGEVSNKGAVQARFEQMLEEIRDDASKVSKFDLSGMRVLFEALLSALGNR